MKKIAIIYWLFICLLGSFSYSMIFNLGLSTSPYFYFSFGDLFFITLILFFLSSIATTPIFFLLKAFLNSDYSIRKKKMYSNGVILIFSVIALLLLYFPTNSFLDAFIIVASFGFFELLFINIYLWKLQN